MKKRRLGRTDLMVSEIGLGCWAIGGPAINLGMGAGWDNFNEQEAKDGLVFSIEKGVNIFDTADVYGFGQSERLLGWLIKKIEFEKLAKREDLFIATKVGYFSGCAIHGYDSLHMRHQLEMSLKNLNTDYADIYFFHHLDFGKNDEYLEDAICQMRRFRESGLIRFIGLRGPHKFSLLRKQGERNIGGGYDRFLELVNLIDPDVVSVRYNMLTPTYDKPESDIFSWAKEEDRGLLTYKPLGQGLLLNKYDPSSSPQFSEYDHRQRKAWFKNKGLTVLKERLEKIGGKFNCKDPNDFVQLAIKYCLSRSDINCVIVGFRDASQLKDSLSLNGTLNEEECIYIKGIFNDVRREIGEFIKF